MPYSIRADLNKIKDMSVKLYSWFKKSALALTLLLAANAVQAQYIKGPWCNWLCSNGTTPDTVYQCKCPNKARPGNYVNSCAVSGIYINRCATANGVGGVNINNVSGSACGNLNYQDFTGLPNMKHKGVAGQNCSLQVALRASNSTWVARLIIYLDINHNGHFENVSDIMVPSASPLISGSNGLSTGGTTMSPYWVFKIPDSAKAGLTRLRIRMGMTTSFSAPGIAGACDTLTYGETEDYDFEIVKPCTPPSIISVDSVTCKSAVVSWKKVDGADGYDVKIDTFRNKPSDTAHYNPVWTNRVSLPMANIPTEGMLSNTKFYVHVKTICDTFCRQLESEWDTSGWTLDSFVTLPCCDMPTPLVEAVGYSGIGKTYATISWNAVFTVQKYEWWISSIPCSAPPSPGTVTNYNRTQVQGLEPDRYYYFMLRAICSPTPYSDIACLPFNTLPTNFIGRTPGSVPVDLAAYPNPVRTKLNVLVSGSDGKGVLTVTDITGNTVYTGAMKNNKAELSTLSWASGMYFIRYSGAEGSKVINITKE
jgi:hypothetical protein